MLDTAEESMESTTGTYSFVMVVLVIAVALCSVASIVACGCACYQRKARKACVLSAEMRAISAVMSAQNEVELGGKRTAGNDTTEIIVEAEAGAGGVSTEL